MRCTLSKFGRQFSGNGNGFNDLLFGGGSAVSFVMANEDGTSYTEYMNPDYIFSQRSTMFDINLDGHLDAFVCHDIDLSHPYLNSDGLGTMVEDQSLIHTLDMPGNYAAIWVDYNNDSHTDLFITKCRGGAAPGNPFRTNRLYRNNGDGTFDEVAEEANMADNAQSWSTVFEDFDNDGDMDIIIDSITKNGEDFYHIWANRAYNDSLWYIRELDETFYLDYLDNLPFSVYSTVYGHDENRNKKDTIDESIIKRIIRKLL